MAKKRRKKKTSKVLTTPTFELSKSAINALTLSVHGVKFNISEEDAIEDVLHPADIELWKRITKLLNAHDDALLDGMPEK